jgi:hypothetical protein
MKDKGHEEKRGRAIYPLSLRHPEPSLDDAEDEQFAIETDCKTK